MEKKTDFFTLVAFLSEVCMKIFKGKFFQSFKSIMFLFHLSQQVVDVLLEIQQGLTSRRY